MNDFWWLHLYVYHNNIQLADGAKSYGKQLLTFTAFLSSLRVPLNLWAVTY